MLDFDSATKERNVFGLMKLTTDERLKIKLRKYLFSVSDRFDSVRNRLILYSPSENGGFHPKVWFSRKTLFLFYFRHVLALLFIKCVKNRYIKYLVPFIIKEPSFFTSFLKSLYKNKLFILETIFRLEPSKNQRKAQFLPRDKIFPYIRWT